MTGTLKKIECEPKCGFMVRSHDEKELVELAIKHAKAGGRPTPSLFCLPESLQAGSPKLRKQQGGDNGKDRYPQ
jgi:hypothetical protein